MTEYLYKPYSNKQYADFVVAHQGRKLCKDSEKVWFEDYPTPSLDELKALKREEINQARDNAEQGGFEYMGKVFDSDQVSCIRMMGASQSLANAPAETTITWTCQDNSTIDLNGTQFAGLVVALATHSNTCHQKATELKAQIDAAETAEELEKITWEDKPAILL